jgi:Flp pilus assembly protein TadG
MRIHNPRSERGAAAVEFALVMPLLFLLVFGIIEFGFIFNKELGVTHSAREGARVYALNGDAAAAQTFAQAASGMTPAPVCTATSVPAVVAPAIPAPGSTVSMTCTTHYLLHLYVIRSSDVTIKSTASARKE